MVAEPVPVESGSPLAEEALRLLQSGLSIVPIRGDGSKAPTMPWKHYQKERMSEGVVRQAFSQKDAAGIAVICGAVSGGVECLDFDSTEAYERWAAYKQVELPHLPLVATRTPGPGYQVWYRIEGDVPGNHVIAKEAGGGKALIETRGEGGYAIIPPSPAACHPSGQPYKMVVGDLAHLPRYSPQIREALHSFAASLNTYVQPNDTRSVRKHKFDNLAGYLNANRVGDRYNAEGRWELLLQKHGWVCKRQVGEVSMWQRPGKNGPGISATLNAVPDHFYVFSSNAAPLEQGKAYDKFGALTTLEYGGDFKAAARALVEQGYGGGDKLSRDPITTAQLVASDIYGVAKLAAPDSADDEKTTVAEPPRFPLLSLSEVLLLPTPKYQIEKFLYEESFSQIFGPPGSGKSLFILDLALSLCFDRPAWFGYRIVQPGPVVWINADGGRGITRRVRSWLTLHGLTSATSRFPFLTLMGSVRLNRPEEMRPFREQILAMPEQPGLVVIDTMSRCLPGVDENSQSEMTAATELCHQLKTATGATLLLIHHTGRSGERDRGSSVVPGELDLQIQVALDARSKTGYVSCTKCREGDPFRPFTYLIRPVGESACAVDPETRQEPRGPRFRDDPYQ